MQLLKAREAAMARFRPMLREHGLTEQQWRVLRVLASWPASDASEIARRSLLLAPSLSRILQHLVTLRLVARRTPPGDQRRALFTLTARGRALFAAVAPDSERNYRVIAQRFGTARLELLYALLAEFVAALDDGGDAMEERGPEKKGPDEPGPKEGDR
ncbi:MAG: homoprotocatechuate degradation operon regulator HpaR [Gammaproteobacteria bacterium]